MSSRSDSDWWDRALARMEALGITQSEVHRRSGLSQTMLQKYSKGSIPGRSALRSLAKALETTPGQLLPDPPIDDESPQVEVRASVADVGDAVDAYLIGSPRGLSTPDAVAARLRRDALWQELGIASPSWDDVDDVRRILERHVSAPPPTDRKKPTSDRAHQHILTGRIRADPNAALVPMTTKKKRGRG